MNEPTIARKNRKRHRIVLLVVTLALMLGATAAWIVPPSAVASISAALTTGNQAERRPGPPGNAGDRPSPSPSASTSPAPSASPSSAPVASPTPSASPAPSAAPSTSGWSPTGIMPAGWQTYHGQASVPFAIYYPAGWTVDESHAQHGHIYFYAPGVTAPLGNATWMMVETTGVRDPDANLDVLRDQYYKEQVSEKYAQAAVQVTRYNSFASMTFASVGAAYSEQGSLCYTYLGIGLKAEVPWSFRLNSPYDAYEQDAATYFSPMLGSLNIYGNP